MHALVRRPSAALTRCELTFLQRQPIDLTLALAQHDAYIAALTAQGCTLAVLPAADDLPDAVFVEDAAVVLDECAVITRPGVESRRGEEDAVASTLEQHRPLHRVKAPGTIEGGDVLRVGRTLFAGRTARTNDDGIRQLAAAIASYGYDVVPVDLRGCLHLKSAVTYAGRETVVLNPDWVGVDVFSRWQAVPVAQEEPYGANVLLVGDTVHVAASAPRTQRKLDALGFHTVTLDTSEFEKAEAALTCLSLLYE